MYFLADGFLLIVGRGVRANVDVDAVGGLHVDVLAEVDADGLLRMGAEVALHAGAGGGLHGSIFPNPSMTTTPGHADTQLQAGASKGLAETKHCGHACTYRQHDGISRKNDLLFLELLLIVLSRVIRLE